ncbi:sulfite exporter TauE/SafE family protein [Alkalibacillus salilacus]|uniref:Probable membrane transporter protein n=1 Tax=Alkalibacillus salilacus TaxID=284582 RepID=A0ABT9VEY2_9BACI|nr:sulfite exporter TauE/SafE family protein [Alkalibacillus salilacus]MDQ0159522.1 putative membrane protein YfcA [Alkalibacillus salilacus]
MVLTIMFIIGLLSAFVGSIAGLGGGVIFVPVLLFLATFSDAFSWVTPQNVVAMSLIVMIFTGLSSTLTFLKRQRVDVFSGSLFLSGSIPGALTGVYVNQFVAVDTFQFYFGLLMLLVTAMFFVKKMLIKENHVPKVKDGRLRVVRTFELSGQATTYSYNAVLGIFIAFFVGMMSGLFGVGGGSLMVPAMILLFGFPAHIAAPTSMFMIFFSSFTSSVAHISAGHVMWLYTLMSIPGSWLGGYLGAVVNQRLNGRTIEWILRMIMIIIGIRLIIQSI